MYRELPPLLLRLRLRLLARLLLALRLQRIAQLLLILRQLDDARAKGWLSEASSAARAARAAAKRRSPECRPSEASAASRPGFRWLWRV
jgi:hypothetical protein